MKHYIYIFIVLMSGAADLFCAGLTPSEHAMLLHDRTTNLVILNDASEFSFLTTLFFKSDIADIDLKNLDNFKPGALQMNLIAALSQGQTVLCTKSLWVSIEEIVRAIQIFTRDDYKPQAGTNEVIYHEKNRFLLID